MAAGCFPGKLLYLTVKLADQQGHRCRLAGRPAACDGAWAHEGGYHDSPPIEPVQRWPAEAEFKMIEQEPGDGYDHILARCR